VTAFVCRECPTNAVGYISPGDKGIGATTALSCRCKSGFVLPPPDGQGIGRPPPVCTACPRGTAPNAQGTVCAKCGNDMTVTTIKVKSKTAKAAGNGQSVEKEIEVGQCACPGPTDVFQQAYKVTKSGGAGAQVTDYSLSCKTCPAGQFAGPGWECKKCADFREEYVKAPSGAGTGWSCGCRAGYTRTYKSNRAGGAGSACVT